MNKSQKRFNHLMDRREELALSLYLDPLTPPEVFAIQTELNDIQTELREYGLIFEPFITH